MMTLGTVHDTAPALVDLALTGDAESLTALIALVQPRVYRWALGFTADPDDADDVAQESFVLMYRRLHQYSRQSSFDGWLYQITRRVANQRQRTGRRRARLAALEDARRELRVYLTDPGARIDRERMVAIVMAHLELLPPRQRELFDLVDLQGYTPAQVAELTGANPSTIRANLFKARATIRAALLDPLPVTDQ
jgi:RNA polymerase sigma-70 factor (ECF subfamily)